VDEVRAEKGENWGRRTGDEQLQKKSRTKNGISQGGMQQQNREKNEEIERTGAVSIWGAQSNLEVLGVEEVK